MTRRATAETSPRLLGPLFSPSKNKKGDEKCATGNKGGIRWPNSKRSAKSRAPKKSVDRPRSTPAAVPFCLESFDRDDDAKIRCRQVGLPNHTKCTAKYRTLDKLLTFLVVLFCSRRGFGDHEIGSVFFGVRIGRGWSTAIEPANFSFIAQLLFCFLRARGGQWTHPLPLRNLVP
nr:hypothetical protein [Pandoravirus massiliensis]